MYKHFPAINHSYHHLLPVSILVTSWLDKMSRHIITRAYHHPNWFRKWHIYEQQWLRFLYLTQQQLKSVPISELFSLLSGQIQQIFHMNICHSPGDNNNDHWVTKWPLDDQMTTGWPDDHHMTRWPLDDQMTTGWPDDHQMTRWPLDDQMTPGWPDDNWMTRWPPFDL